MDPMLAPTFLLAKIKMLRRHIFHYCACLVNAVNHYYAACDVIYLLCSL